LSCWSPYLYYFIQTLIMTLLLFSPSTKQVLLSLYYHGRTSETYASTKGKKMLFLCVLYFDLKFKIFRFFWYIYGKIILSHVWFCFSNIFISKQNLFGGRAEKPKSHYQCLYEIVQIWRSTRQVIISFILSFTFI
jgi:hypothetical protein